VTLHLEAARERIEFEHNARAWAAWHTAALQRSRKMVPLKQLLVGDVRRERQTPEEKRAILRAIAAAYGGLKKNG